MGEVNLEPYGVPTASTCDCVCTVRTCRYCNPAPLLRACLVVHQAVPSLRAACQSHLKQKSQTDPLQILARPGSICGIQLHQNTTTTQRTRPSPQPDDLHSFRGAEDVFAASIFHPPVAFAPRHRTPAPNTVAAIRPVCARPPPRRQPLSHNAPIPPPFQRSILRRRCVHSDRIASDCTTIKIRSQARSQSWRVSTPTSTRTCLGATGTTTASISVSVCLRDVMTRYMARTSANLSCNSHSLRMPAPDKHAVSNLSASRRLLFAVVDLAHALPRRRRL